MENSQLLCSLIKDEIINTKLINGLSQLGLDATHYHLHLSETIFQLAGFENNHQSDLAYARFLTLIRESSIQLTSCNEQSLQLLSHQVYHQLVTLKTPCLMKKHNNTAAGKRRLKISSKHSSRETLEFCVLPEIRLTGKWLQELGFRCGKMVLVQANENQLIITVDQ